MKAAFLSSSLISSKGSAGPATKSLPPGELLEKSKRAERIFNRSETPQPQPRPQEAMQAPALAPTRPHFDEPAEEPVTARAHDLVRQEVLIQKEATDQLRRDKLGRVRMSIRMSPEQHLQLKLIAAHTRKSAQTIMDEALSEYVDNHGEELIPAACACIRNKLYS